MPAIILWVTANALVAALFFVRGRYVRPAVRALFGPKGPLTRVCEAAGLNSAKGLNVDFSGQAFQITGVCADFSLNVLVRPNSRTPEAEAVVETTRPRARSTRNSIR